MPITITDDPVVRNELEHDKGLHDPYPWPTCIRCFPDGPPDVPVRTQPDQPTELAPHRFHQSNKFVDGQRVCVCGLPRKMIPPHPPVPEFKGIGTTLAKLVASFKIDPTPGEPMSDDPYAPPDDGGPPCDGCHGWRHVPADPEHKLPVGDPLFGKLVACKAPACLAWTIQKRVARLWGDLPLEARDWTLDTYPTPSDLHRRVLAAGRKWLEDPGADPRIGLPWLWPWGPPGRGKTGLAVALLDAAIRRGRTGSFQNARDLYERIKLSYDSKASHDEDEHSLLNSLYDVDLFVLDGIGEGYTTDWAWGLIWNVLAHRYTNMRQTVITSNLGPHDLEKLEGFAPVVSRILHRTYGKQYVWPFKSFPDLRKKP